MLNITQMRELFTLRCWVLALSLLLIGMPSPSTAETSGTAASATAEPTADDNNTQATIAAVSTPKLDSDIRERLQGIYSELDQFANIEVSVSNSVVLLSGKLLSASAIKEAEQLAAKVNGVADVDNQLTVETDVSERLDSSITELATESRAVLSSLPLYLLAFAIVVLSWFLGRSIANRHRWLERITPNAFIAELVGNIFRLAVLITGLFLALKLLGATEVIGTVLGAAGIVGLALGFAVRDTVENYIASILLSLRNPFKTRDYVAVDGYEGSVARLTSRATILVSSEGNHIRIPNAIVYKSVITNYSRNPLRRFDFNVGIDSADDILSAQKTALATLETVPGVLQDPEPSVTVAQLSDSNTTLLIRAWMNQQSHDLLKIRSEAIRLVKGAFDEAGIVMPEPTYQLIIRDANNLPPKDLPLATNTAPKTISTDSTPVQSTTAENTADLTIEAELAISDEQNLLSENTAHE